MTFVIAHDAVYFIVIQYKDYTNIVILINDFIPQGVFFFYNYWISFRLVMQVEILISDVSANQLLGFRLLPWMFCGSSFTKTWGLKSIVRFPREKTTTLRSWLPTFTATQVFSFAKATSVITWSHSWSLKKWVHNFPYSSSSCSSSTPDTVLPSVQNFFLFFTVVSLVRTYD